jgi:hypothetical protein
MRKILLIISLFISFTVSASSLSENLNTYFTQLDSSENDSISISINENIRKEVLSFAEVDSNFYKTSLDCKRIGSVISSDNKLKIISWNYKLSDGRFGYEAIIIKNSNKKKPKVKVWKASCKEAFKPAENKRYSLSKWYGALYYSIIPWKGDYILLGYSTYNNISKVKVIELLSFENKTPSFGEKVFKKENKTYQRMVFEYSYMANMSLVYSEERNEFVFDHLSPEEPSMKGLYQYYGPDFSVDVLQENRKFWEYKSDVDVRNN